MKQSLHTSRIIKKDLNIIKATFYSLKTVIKFGLNYCFICCSSYLQGILQPPNIKVSFQAAE